jgi:hypothetical protein
MRLKILLFSFILCGVASCTESEDPKISVVETLQVNQSFSSSRTFQGNVKNLADNDTIVAYGFEWESRYASWKALKSGGLKKGKFVLKDTTRLSKWTSYSVRAFLETKRGLTYGNVVTFTTEGK